MKIVIAGAGAVGTHLAKLLAREHHDIILIDEDETRLADLNSNFDLMALHGNPSSVSILREAGAARADLFIGVTPDEARNMTCCMLAAKLGAKKTVARVDNYEYTLPEHRAFFKTVGIGSVIYPELLAGTEIAHNVRRSWTRQWIEVQGGALVLIGVKVRKNARLLDIPLRNLCGPDAPYHVVAIKRHRDTLIPHGNDSLQDGDLAYFMTTPKYAGYLRELTGKEDYPDVHNLFIMGGSDTALHTVENLPDDLHAKIFEPDERRCLFLNEAITNRHTMIIHGDGRDLELLVDEGIRRAQAFAALSDNSEANILACLAAKQMGASKTVAMVENTDYVHMAESLDIGSIVNKKTLAAGHIYQMMLKADVASMKSLVVANADVAEFPVPAGAKITRRPVRELGLPVTVTLGGLVREGRGLLINGSTQILPGDTVVAFCLQNNINKLARFFT